LGGGAPRGDRAAHDFAVAGDELMPSEERREQARLAVVAVLDRARKAGVSEADVDGLHLAWATTEEIAGRLGVGREELLPLRDHALDTGLLCRFDETATPDPRSGDEQVGWALTPAGGAAWRPATCARNPGRAPPTSAGPSSAPTRARRVPERAPINARKEFMKSSGRFLRFQSARRVIEECRGIASAHRVELLCARTEPLRIVEKMHTR